MPILDRLFNNLVDLKIDASSLVAIRGCDLYSNQIYRKNGSDFSRVTSAREITFFLKTKNEGTPVVCNYKLPLCVVTCICITCLLFTKKKMRAKMIIQINTKIRMSNYSELIHIIRYVFLCFKLIAAEFSLSVTNRVLLIHFS